MQLTNSPRRSLLAVLTLVAGFAMLAACGSDGATTETETGTETDTDTDTGTETETSDDSSGQTSDDASDESTGESDDAGASATGSSTFTAEIWADNWFALYVNGVLIGEDSVPITTERSFNAETISFEADYPLTVAVEAKDFKETDSGIEYIGEGNQQMGDGGLIMQITDESTGEVVAGSSGSWSALVIHRAPLNTSCEKDPDPDTTCEFESTEAPADWASASFDDSGWSSATEWSEGAVSPKDGYDQINWDSTASLIWGSDLEVDNTVLFRTTVGS